MENSETLIRCCVLQLLIWVYTVCSGLSVQILRVITVSEQNVSAFVTCSCLIKTVSKTVFCLIKTVSKTVFCLIKTVSCRLCTYITEEG